MSRHRTHEGLEGVTTRVTRYHWAPFVAYVALMRDGEPISRSSCAPDDESVRRKLDDMKRQYVYAPTPRPAGAPKRERHARKRKPRR